MPTPDLGPSVPLAPALYPSSVYALPDLDALDRVTTGAEAGFIYARDNHPNAVLLEEALAELEGANWAVVCGSGMGALTTAVLALVGQGDRLLASNQLYGRTTNLLGQELKRYGVRADFADTNDLAAVRTALADTPPAKMLLVETISNPLLRVGDLPALVELCHAHGCQLLVDNTFATPALLRPLDLGADLVMESLTKMIGGHSDVTLGVLAGRGDQPTRLRQVRSVWGFMAGPFECWQAQRGLPTLTLRMDTACASADALAEWLPAQPGVKRVIHPSLSHHPDNALAERLFDGLFGNMLCVELAGGRDAVNRFMRAAPGIPFCPSLGDVTTTCSHPVSTSHRYVDPAERDRQGITPGLLRVSVGIEPVERLMDEFERGLRAAAG
jgi:cystathionine beta-lyase/cystathionine gamma-synthase